VTITDALNCKAVVQVALTDPLPLQLSPVIVDLPCEEVCIGSITLNASGSHPPYTYQWSNGQTADPLTNLCQGSYAVTVSDTKNCQVSDTFNVAVDYIFKDLKLWATDDTIFEGQTTMLNATDISGLSYAWSPFAGLASPNASSTQAKPEQTQLYHLLVTDGDGCSFRDSLLITVRDVVCGEPYIYLPNAFTPNNDQKNDVLYVRGKVFGEMQLLIYNRWGEKVFGTTDQNTGWDGRFRGEFCDPGVFVYYLRVKCFNEEVFEKKGNVTLIR
jgi:gliding motility-associated-like protein